MGEVTSLRKENDELKKQLQEIQKELSTVKKKVTAPSRKQHGAERLNLQTPLVIAQPDDKPNQNDVQFLNVTQENILSKLEEMESKIGEIAQNTDRISKAIDDIQAYSYQYNLKIVGVPQAETTEKATDTVELCLKIFAGIGVEVSPLDIDVAHRVPAKSQDGCRRGNLPIICKFTRRMVHDEVLSRWRNCNLLLPATFGLNSENELRISIFSHLTSRLQEIFYLAKSVKEHDNYKYCWAKDTAIYLRKSDNSRAIKITSLQDIEALRHSRDDASSHVNTTR